MPDERPADPLAVYVATLFGTMSYRDQAWANAARTWLLGVTAVIGYLAGWYLERFAVTAYVVVAATAVALVALVPNWRQRPDSENAHWLDRDHVRRYYAELDAAEEAFAQADANKPKIGIAAHLRGLLPARALKHGCPPPKVKEADAKKSD
jgi:hypothetical protein